MKKKDEDKQLVLFNDAPKSRQNKLLAIAKRDGVEAAIARNDAMTAFRPLTDAIKARIERLGTSAKEARFLYMALNRQIHTAIGAKANAANPQQCALFTLLRYQFASILNAGHTRESESKKRKAACDAIRSLCAAFDNIEGMAA